MKGSIAVASILAQLAGFLAIGWMFYDLFTLPDTLFDAAGADTETMRQYYVETVVSYRYGLGVGMLGAIASWLLILKGRFRAAWFLATARVLAWIWMPLVPVGTILGVLILNARSSTVQHENSPDE